jgi:hypothetical protein
VGKLYIYLMAFTTSNPIMGVIILAMFWPNVFSLVMWPFLLAQVWTCYPINFSNFCNLIKFSMIKITQNSITINLKIIKSTLRNPNHQGPSNITKSSLQFALKF